MEVERLTRKIQKYEEFVIPGLGLTIKDVILQSEWSQPFEGRSPKTPMNVIEERQIPLQGRGLQGGSTSL
jgi:hypothetical protein